MDYAAFNKILSLKFIVCLLFLVLVQNADSQNVFFGERNLKDQKLALYFDQQGTVYPDFLIPDSSLQRCSGNISDWYKSHPSEFGEICKIYDCKLELINAGSLQILQDSIVQQIGRKINALNGQAVSFLIHGYRKSFNDTENGVSSVREFEMLRTKLDSLGLKNDLFVEVYWDATYNCCFSTNKKKNDSLFRQFEFAQQNAPQVGLSLRKIMWEVKAPKLNVIAHSLGCKVAVASLFNMVPSEIRTPKNERVNICLVAPAIGGESVFAHYYERKANSKFMVEDNYRLYILYNEKDFVLRKKDNKMGVFGPGTSKYGETTLGCNYQNETTRLVEYFAEHFPNSTIQLQDMTYLGKRHSLRYYTLSEHLKEMVHFLNQ